jgi:DNA-binding GntR family transcriptional regulator
METHSLSTLVARKSTTLADDIYETVRSDILACRMAPGTKIKINDLGERNGVSLGAVREALSRLSAEGLVLARAQRGYSVASVSVDDLKDVSTARMEIEAICMERSIMHGTLAWESAIVAAAHRLSRTPERLPHGNAMSEEWLAAHDAYHYALIAACDSLHLLRIRNHLYQQSERYRRLSLPLGRGIRDLGAEHRELAEAVLDRDAARAVALIRQHISRTSEVILETMSGLSQQDAGGGAKSDGG